jgi:hypothetical protein
LVHHPVIFGPIGAGGGRKISNRAGGGGLATIAVCQIFCGNFRRLPKIMRESPRRANESTIRDNEGKMNIIFCYRPFSGENSSYREKKPSTFGKG